MALFVGNPLPRKAVPCTGRGDGGHRQGWGNSVSWEGTSCTSRGTDPTALQRLTLQTGAAGLSPVPPAPARWPCWEPTWPASGLLGGGQGPASAYSALSTPPWPPICRTGSGTVFHRDLSPESGLPCWVLTKDRLCRVAGLGAAPQADLLTQLMYCHLSWEPTKA